MRGDRGEVARGACLIDQGIITVLIVGPGIVRRELALPDQQCGRRPANQIRRSRDVHAGRRRGIAAAVRHRGHGDEPLCARLVGHGPHIEQAPRAHRGAHMRGRRGAARIGILETVAIAAAVPGAPRAGIVEVIGAREAGAALLGHEGLRMEHHGVMAALAHDVARLKVADGPADVPLIRVRQGGDELVGRRRRLKTLAAVVRDGERDGILPTGEVHPARAQPPAQVALKLIVHQCMDPPAVVGGEGGEPLPVAEILRRTRMPAAIHHRAGVLQMLEIRAGERAIVLMGGEQMHPAARIAKRPRRGIRRVRLHATIGAPAKNGDLLPADGERRGGRRCRQRGRGQEPDRDQ